MACPDGEPDPDFQKTLAALVEDIKAKGGDALVQTATVTGDHNVTTQIAGSGNVVRATNRQSEGT